MKNKFKTTVTVKSGRFKGKQFRVEAPIKDMPEPSNLPSLACNGNWAAANALSVDGYKISDEPFYYGKIGAFGYIISGKDLGL